VLNWFGDWSTGALYQVGQEFTQKLDVDKADVSANFRMSLYACNTHTHTHTHTLDTICPNYQYFLSIARIVHSDGMILLTHCSMPESDMSIDTILTSV